MNRKKMNEKELERMANRLRIKVVKMMKKAGGGHIGGSMSIAEIISVLYFNELNINPKDPLDPNRDRFILSKGHACFTLYAALSEIGFITEDDLMTPYEVDSPIQAHPELGLCPGIDMGTGALGQGLSAGIGMALGARIKKRKYRVYVIVGDGEAMEGMVWEAAMATAKYKLDNLVAILDYNKLALSGTTQDVMPLEPIYDKWKSFGWHVIEADGHSVSEIMQALKTAKQIKGKPTIIIAHTVKGKMIKFCENKPECHAVIWDDVLANEALNGLGATETEIAEKYE